MKRMGFFEFLLKTSKKCQDWHNGAGDKVWNFTDEIVVD